MRFILAIALFAALTGCGPLLIPMAPQLSPEDQHTVDQMWDNLLTPVQRVDRETLLDANVAYSMFTMGVDRLHMTSEKYFAGGTVVMEIDCDRANPQVDQFVIKVLDERGRTVRRERYTRADVEESSRMMGGSPNLRAGAVGLNRLPAEPGGEIGQPTTRPSTHPSTQQATTEPETPAERKFRLESERRQLAATAATQPARLSTPASGTRGR